MKVKAAAKINLMLDVLGTLPNGYHSLFMIMQSVSCYDTVCVNKTGKDEIVIKTADRRIPTDEKNIAYKAAKEFFSFNSIKDCGIEIEIEKNIPMAAGLAGGSADGAGVIYCLNELYNTDLPLSVLCSIGERVGADVPFALTGGTALCMDTGGVIARLPELKDCFTVLCKPDMSVSTINAYRLLDEAEYLRHADKTAMLYAMKNRDYLLMAQKAKNVFEQVIEVPKRPYIKSAMKQFGADFSLMSGSGPTVYGVFSDEPSAERCARYLKTRFPETILCAPCKAAIEVIEK